MPDVEASTGVSGRTKRLLACAIAVALVGASPNPMPRLGKADRPPSPADCRSGDAAGSLDCLGVVLPATRGEVALVAPGLSVVGLVED